MEKRQLMVKKNGKRGGQKKYKVVESQEGKGQLKAKKMMVQGWKGRNERGGGEGAE